MSEAGSQAGVPAPVMSRRRSRERTAWTIVAIAITLAAAVFVRPALLMLDEPTRGVDVGAKAELHRLIRELAAKGMSTLVVSSDLPELLALCDRILVMCEGRIAGELDGASASEEDVMRLAFPKGGGSA